MTVMSHTEQYQYPTSGLTGFIPEGGAEGALNVLGPQFGDMAFEFDANAFYFGGGIIGGGTWVDDTYFTVTGRPLEPVTVSGTFRFQVSVADTSLTNYIHQPYKHMANFAWEITVAPGDVVTFSSATIINRFNSPTKVYPDLPSNLSERTRIYNVPGTYVFAYEGEYTFMDQYLYTEFRHEDQISIQRGVGAGPSDFGGVSGSRLIYGGAGVTADLRITTDYFEPPVSSVPEPSAILMLMGAGPLLLGLVRRRKRSDAVPSTPHQHQA